MRWKEDSMQKQSSIEIMAIAEIDRSLMELRDSTVEKWGEGNIPLIVLASGYARILIEQWQSIDDREKKTFFSEIERLFCINEEELQTIVATGFLERLSFDILSDKISFSILEPFLGEKSKEYCAKICSL